MASAPRPPSIFGWMTAGILSLTTAACGDEALYKIDPGPHEVRIIDDISLRDPLQDREIRYRVLYPDSQSPDSQGPFPVVVFSTGMFCLPQLYDRITGHWVSHGYVVVEPNHPDSPNNAKPPTTEDLEIVVEARLRDVSFALDSLDQIAERADIGEKIDAGRIAVAGHSFGAVISMVKTGLKLKPKFQDSFGGAYDERFQAAVLMSAPGPGMEEMADNAYASLSKPLMVTGGTNDVGRVDPGDLSPGEWRKQAFYLAPPGDKYSVIVEGSDHYLGGLICNASRGGDPDPGAVEILRVLTTTFLDAYVKEEPDALEFLKTADVAGATGGRAAYDYK